MQNGFQLSEIFVYFSVNSINLGAKTPGKNPMFGRSQDGGNNYKCRKQF